MIKVTTIDGIDTRINTKMPREEILAELNSPAPAIVFIDEVHVLWFPKVHIIKVSIRE